MEEIKETNKLEAVTMLNDQYTALSLISYSDATMLLVVTVLRSDGDHVRTVDEVARVTSLSTFRLGVEFVTPPGRAKLFGQYDLIHDAPIRLDEFGYPHLDESKKKWKLDASRIEEIKKIIDSI